MVQRIGVVGCGNISDIYLTNAAHFTTVTAIACADLRSGAAGKTAARYGLRAMSVADLLGADDVELSST